MLINRNAETVQNDWKTLKSGEMSFQGMKIVFTLKELNELGAHLESLLQKTAGFGLLILSDQTPFDFVQWIEKADLICLEFPKFSDGRAYSTARLLRGRFAYEGEIRAVGHVLPDQIAFMVKCGFDTFEMHRGFDRQVLKHALSVIRHAYQGDLNETLSILQKRHASA